MLENTHDKLSPYIIKTSRGGTGIFSSYEELISPCEYWKEIQPKIDSIVYGELFNLEERYGQGKKKPFLTVEKRIEQAESAVEEFKEGHFTSNLDSLYKKFLNTEDEVKRQEIYDALATKYEEIEESLNYRALRVRLESDYLQKKKMASQLEIYKPGFWLLAIWAAASMIDIVLNH